jgi:Capsule polysaccharide biosynthesis protein
MEKLYDEGRPADESKGTLLFWVPGGMPLLLHVEASIAAAMKLRGYNVHAIICNSPYRACAARTAGEGLPIESWRDVCGSCMSRTSGFLDTMGIPYSFNGEFITETEREELWEKTADVTWENSDSLRFEGLSVGSNARSSIVRYLQGASLTGHEPVVREFAYSALVTALTSRRVLERFKPWRVFMSHGVYVDWGPALHTARSLGIPVTVWKSSYVPSHFYIRNVVDPARIEFNRFSDEAWEETLNSELTPRQNARLDKFFHDRYEKQISFDMRLLGKRKHKADVSALRAKYAAGDKPIWAVFSHINWDSVADFSPMAYPSFDEWILDTIRQAIKTPDVQWLIKIHPLEAWDNPGHGVQRLVERCFPNLPDHVRLIPCQEAISSANMYELIDGGVTVYGTAGLELALSGKPVILAGEAHFGGKGFTYDGLSPDTYRALLSRASTIGPLSEVQRETVRKYAYSHFIQRQVPLNVLKNPESAWWRFQVSKRELLVPGNDPFAQFVCDRLLDGKDMCMPESLVQLSEREVPQP